MKKLTLIVSAFALVLGLSQCKKPDMPMYNGSFTGENKTITFTTGNNSKSVIDNSVAGVLDFKWEANDVLYVYGSEVGDFSDGKFCGKLNLVGSCGSKEGTFTGVVEVPTGDDAKLRFYYFGGGVTETELGGLTYVKATFDLSSQNGSLGVGGLHERLVAMTECDVIEYGEEYSGELAVEFSIAQFDLSAFAAGTSENITMKGVKYNGLSVDEHGCVNLTSGSEITLSKTNLNEKKYYVAVIKKDAKVLSFVCGNLYGSKKVTNEDNVFCIDNTQENKSIIISIAEDLLPGEYSVSADKVVRFTKGNLYYDGTEFKFENYQCDNRTVYNYSKYARINKAETSTPSGNWGLFGWSTASTTYGMSYSSNNSDYSGDFKDWGTAFGNVYHTLSKDEWQYLLGCNGVAAYRPDATEKRKFKSISFDGTSVKGLVILPDNVDKSKMSEISSSADLVTYNAVFLPGVRNRNVNGLWGNGNDGHYWTSTLVNSYDAYGLYTSENSIGVGESYEQGHPESGRQCGYAVRLVCNAE